VNILSYVEDLDLSDGQKHRGKCPECGRSNTFTATNKMGKLVWNCYANSCSLSGAKNIPMSVDEIRKRMKDFKINRDLALDHLEKSNYPYKDKKINVKLPEVFSLPEWVKPYTPYDSDLDDSPKAIVDKFCERYGLWAEDLELHYDIKEDRIVFPVQDNGKLVDAVGRAIDDSVIPKWKRYGTYAEGFIRGQHQLAIVVEDVVSACVIETLGATGVAILGTTLNANHIEALRGFKRVIVALDPDAAEKTIAYTKMLRANGVHTLALKLLDDIKYRKEEDILFITNTIKEFNGTFTTKEFAK